jgi:hypothetical protein
LDLPVGNANELSSCLLNQPIQAKQVAAYRGVTPALLLLADAAVFYPLLDVAQNSISRKVGS